MICKIWQEAMI